MFSFTTVDLIHNVCFVFVCKTSAVFAFFTFKLSNLIPVKIANIQDVAVPFEMIRCHLGHIINLCTCYKGSVRKLSEERGKICKQRSGEWSILELVHFISCGENYEFNYVIFNNLKICCALCQIEITADLVLTK